MYCVTVRAFIRTALVGALLATALGARATASAQVPGEAVTVVDPIDIPPENDPLAHAWDIPGERSGFYLRLSTSIGVQNTRLGRPPWEDDLNSRTINGFASGYGLQLGGLLRPWLALHADASVGVLWNGDIEETALYGRTRNGRVVAYGFAPAATFFTPNDFYFTPAFGVGFATVKERGRSNTTDPGFYMNLTAGKEVYTGPRASVGLQFQVIYMLLGDDDPNREARVRQFLFGVSFGFDSGG